MKNKLLAIMAVFGMVASASAVKINNNLSINGFIDGSFKLVDNETGADDQGLDADEAELNFVLSNGAVSGLISVDTQEADGTSDLDIEQAHFSYDLGNGISLPSVVMVLLLVSSVKILLVFTLTAVHTTLLPLMLVMLTEQVVLLKVLP